MHLKERFIELVKLNILLDNTLTELKNPSKCLDLAMTLDESLILDDDLPLFAANFVEACCDEAHLDLLPVAVAEHLSPILVAV